MASTLQKVAEFRSFVKPTWRPKLSPFCISLTGITQVSVSHSPTIVRHLDALVSTRLGTGRWRTPLS
jgi:inhibitor of KinA sporulation pathway (predicted exonuclease)